MSRKQAELLLAAVILTRSSAYLFSKTGLETLGTFNILAARFLLGFVVLGIIFFRRLKYASRRDIIGGAIIGAVLGVVSSASRSPFRACAARCLYLQACIFRICSSISACAGKRPHKPHNKKHSTSRFS